MGQGNQLIGIAELKRYLNWADDDISNDDFFNDLINAVSCLLEEYCNTKLKACDVVEKVSGDGSVKLYLSNRPVSAVKSIRYFDGGSFTDYMTSGDIAKYIVALDHAVYNRAEIFDAGIFNYEVEYTCGFDPIPQDLKLVCQELCAIFFKNSFLGEGRVGLVSNQQGNFKMFFLDSLPFHRKVLDKYRLINV